MTMKAPFFMGVPAFTDKAKIMDLKFVKKNEVLKILN